MNYLTPVWNEYILPQLNFLKRYRLLTSSAAATFVFAYLLIEKCTLPPRNIRHIPHANIFRSLASLFSTINVENRTKSLADPLIFKTEHGLYSSFTFIGWIVSITDPDIAKEFLFKSDTFEKQSNRERFIGTILGQFILGPSMLFLNGKRWKEQRKIANPAFHRQVPLALFGRLTEKLFAVIDKTDGPVDTYNLMERWTLDAIGIAGFGFDFDAINNDDNEWIHRYHHIMKEALNLPFVAFPILEQKYIHHFPKRMHSHRELKTFFDMIQGLIDKKRKAIEEEKDQDIDNANNYYMDKDLLHLMIESGQSEGKGLTDEELVSNVCIFFFAGHDTTASALSTAICLLAMHPEVQEKARNEAIGIFGDAPENVVPTADQLQKLTYINMVIKETLRMYPPLDTLISRAALKDTTLGDVLIPKGTQVTVSTYLLHRNPRVWENPDIFDPERFAPGNEYEAKQAYNWLPFSSGSRQCIGMNFSLAEQRVLLCMMLRKYEWQLPKDTIHTPKQITTKSVMGIMSPNDLNVKFRRRY